VYLGTPYGVPVVGTVLVTRMRCWGHPLRVSGFIRLPTEGYTQGGRFWVGVRRDQELEGADNTRFRQVQAAICVMPYVLYNGLYCLDVDLVILFLRGFLPGLIYPGGQGYMNPSLILA
jgi:hypothetical protein